MPSDAARSTSSRRGFRPGLTRPAPWHSQAPEARRPDVLDHLDLEGLRLRAAAWRGAGRGTALLLTGRTEYIEKYALLADEFVRRGFSVATLDWRGQGASDRDPRVDMLGHVDDFAEYQADLAAFDAWQADILGEPGPRIMVAHSMGGCIGLRALIDGALSSPTSRPAAAIFSAPMWGLALPRLGAAGARALARAAVRFGFAHRRARGAENEKTYVLDAPFDGNVLVCDPAIWTRFAKEARARRELTLGSPSLGWLDAAFREMRALQGAGPLPIPSLLLLGDEEAVVSPAAIEARADDPGARLVRLAGARHEPLMEAPNGAVGRPARAAMTAFLDDLGL